MKIETRDMPFGCDFCAVEQPEWTFRLPPGTTILATLNTVTGLAEVTKSTGFMGACGDCRAAIEKPVSSRAQVLAHRLFRVTPRLVALKGGQRRRALKAAIKNFKRLLRALEPGPRPYCPNEDPMEAKGVFLDTRDGPEPQDLN